MLTQTIKKPHQIDHLVIPLLKEFTSFCYFDRKTSSGTNDNLISISLLENAIKFCEKNKLGINFLYGVADLPLRYKKLIDRSAHGKIIPSAISHIYDDGIIVVNCVDSSLPEVKYNNTGIINLRIARTALASLSEIVANLSEKCMRLNVYLIDMHTFTSEELETYKTQLALISQIIEKRFYVNPIEISTVSDMLNLGEHNSCGAGLNHIFLGLNGNFYICPGFYNDAPCNTIGSIYEGLNIDNAFLYTVRGSPICSLCDTFHCKRCVYLNQKTTSEINIPSKEQCQIAHIERSSTKEISDRLRKDNRQTNAAVRTISSVECDDPLDLLVRNKTRLPGNVDSETQDEMEFEDFDEKSMLIKIYKKQLDIEKWLLNLEKGVRSGKYGT